MKNKLMERRRAAGLCVQCGNVETATWRYTGCSEKHNADLRRRRQDRKAACQCAFCSKPTGGMMLCEDCRKRANRAKREYYFQQTMAAELQMEAGRIR